jgi:3-dehydroquinate synthase/shikimate kinase/3-dehydroquinate synthase
LESLELKTDYSNYSYENLKNYILNDKKVSKGKLNLVLINEKGTAFKTDKYNSKNLKKALS